jgi:hypothetical protein
VSYGLSFSSKVILFVLPDNGYPGGAPLGIIALLCVAQPQAGKIDLARTHMEGLRTQNSDCLDNAQMSVHHTLDRRESFRVRDPYDRIVIYLSRCKKQPLFITLSFSLNNE